jgi:hypothetical protein
MYLYGNVIFPLFDPPSPHPLPPSPMGALQSAKILKLAIVARKFKKIIVRCQGDFRHTLPKLTVHSVVRYNCIRDYFGRYRDMITVNSRYLMLSDIIASNVRNLHTFL